METSFWLFVLVGFIAQMIDGSLGMAYGVSASSFLLSLGVSPAIASAGVHTAEVFTTAISGISHWRLGNLDRDLIKRLLIPGVLGGVTGAYLLTKIDGNFIKPYISIYLLIMGARIIYKAFKPSATKMQPIHLTILGIIGGVFDAIGGGGWGPIVTTTLLANGNQPRKTIGSVNFSEFFITFAEATTFIFTIGLTNLQVILGLILGGAVAAPLGAMFTQRVPRKPLMIAVGLLIIALSLRTLYQVWA